MAILFYFILFFSPRRGRGSGRSFPGPALAHGAVLLSRFGAGGPRYGLHGGRQCAEETGDEGQAQTPPGAEHGPAVAVADVVGQAVQVARVARQLKVDAGDAGAQGDDAEGAWRKNKHTQKKQHMGHDVTSQACHQQPPPPSHI